MKPIKFTVIFIINIHNQSNEYIPQNNNKVGLIIDWLDFERTSSRY